MQSQITKQSTYRAKINSKRNSIFLVLFTMCHIELGHISYSLVVTVLSKFDCHIKLNLTPFMLVLLHIIYETCSQFTLSQ